MCAYVVCIRELCVCVYLCVYVCLCVCVCACVHIHVKLWNTLLVSGYLPTTSRDIKAQWGLYHDSPRTIASCFGYSTSQHKVGSISEIW